MPAIERDVSDTGAKIQAICLRLLTRREYSQQELVQKLQLKGFSREDSLPIIATLTQQNWQSDDRYAENYARSCIQRGYGPVFIQYHLRQQGINTLNLDDMVAATVGSWQAHIEQVYQRKYSDHSILTRTEWAKRCRFLQQRGFSDAMIRALLASLKSLSM